MSVVNFHPLGISFIKFTLFPNAERFALIKKIVQLDNLFSGKRNAVHSGWECLWVVPYEGCVEAAGADAERQAGAEDRWWEGGGH